MVCVMPVCVLTDCLAPAPHLGHLYSAVLADAAGRYAALRHGRSVLLSTGTDEHGLKVRQAAAAAGCSAAQLSAEVSAQYRAAFDAADVQYGRYVRTTEPEHHRAVQHFWVRLTRRMVVLGSAGLGWWWPSVAVRLSLTATLPGSDLLPVSYVSPRPLANLPLKVRLNSFAVSTDSSVET